jgi:MFS family permease
VLPVANAIVSRRFPKEKGKYLALVNATYGLGMVAGINIGGITFDALGWRWMFILTTIVSAVAVLLSVIWLKDPDGDEQRERHPVDFAGSALFAVAVAAFMMLFRSIGNESASSTQIVVWAAVLAVAGVVFVLRERSVSYPAVDLSTFRRPAYLTYNLVAFCFGIGMFVLTTMLPTFGQALVGFGVSQSVYAVDPFAAGMIIFTMASAPLIKRFGPRVVLLAGGIAFAAATLLVALFTFGEAGFFVNTILVSIGLGLCMTPMNYIVIEAGGDRNEGSSAGMVSVMRSLGGVVGPTIAGLIMSRIDYSSLFVMDNILNAYSHVFLTAFVAVIAMSALSAVGIIIRKRPFKEAAT